MNAPLETEAHNIRLADLSDVAEVGRIDAWVLDHSDSTPFHRPCWLNSVQAGTQQQAHMLIAERDKAITAVLPFHLVHSPLFGRALVSSGFAVGGGILSCEASANRRLVTEICALAERWSCQSIELRGGWMPRGGWAAPRCGRSARPAAKQVSRQ